MVYLIDDKNYVLTKMIPDYIRNLEGIKRSDFEKAPLEKKYYIAKESAVIGRMCIIAEEYHMAGKYFQEALNNATDYFERSYPDYINRLEHKIAVEYRSINTILQILFLSNRKDELKKYTKMISRLAFCNVSEWQVNRNIAFCKLANGNLDLSNEIKFFFKAERKLPSGFEYSKGYQAVFRGIKKKERDDIYKGLNLILKKYHQGYRREWKLMIADYACIIYNLTKLNNIELDINEVYPDYQKHIPKYVQDLY